MPGKDVELKIGGDSSEGDAAFDKVAKSAEKAGQRITQTMREASYNMAASCKSATESMVGSFEKVNKMLLGFTAILAGGAAFKEALGESNKLTMEANKLGNQLGISATDAGVLNVAMNDLNAALGYNGIDSETVLNANNKLTKTLGTNELAFKDLGVQTRDTNGHFRNSLDIMLDVNSKLLDFKEGTDRNIEGQKIYGKQWKEVQGILGMTTEKMEEARKKSEELGVVIGKENVEATNNYRTAMNDVEDVLSGMMKTVGDALMPILTDLGNWFASVGPEAVIAMKGAIGGVAAAFYGLKMAVDIVAEVINLFVKTAYMSLVNFATAASKALQFDFAGAKAAWNAGGNAIAEEFGAALDRITINAEANRDRLINLFSKPIPTAKKEGGTTSEGGIQGGGRTQIGEWRAELEAKKEADGQFLKNSLADDEAFWTAKLSHVQKGSKDEIAVKHELFAIHKQLAVQKFTADQDTLKAEIAASRAGSAERIALATEAARRVGETYGWESSEYMASIKEIKKAADEFDKDQQKLAEMKVARAREHAVAMIGMERDQLASRKNLGQISDQEEIAQLKVLKDQEYQIEVQAQQDKIALMDKESPEKQKQLDELAKMQDKHSAEMAQLDIKSVEAVKKAWDTLLSPITSAFDASINGMIMGTQTFRKAIANIGQSIVAEFINMGVKMAKDWATNELTKTTFTKTGTVARAMLEKLGLVQTATAQETTSTTTVVAKKAEAAAVIPAEAAEAAGGAASAVAAIPVVGPALAVAAYADTMAMIMGGLGVASSAGGEWRVPTDRLNLVHKNETILPAHVAEPLRNMVEGGGVGGGDVHLHIHAAVADAKGFETWLKNNSSTLTPAMRNLKRNFAQI